MNKNVASQKITVFAFDYSTGAPKTGDAGNLTVYVSKDDGSVTALGDTSATELSSTNAPGSYTFDLTQAETNANKLVFSGKSSTANVAIVPQTIYPTPPNFAALGISSGGSVFNVAAMTESYAAVGVAPTPEQCLWAILQWCYECDLSGTDWFVRKLDGSTQAAKLALNDGTNPTTRHRSA